VSRPPRTARHNLVMLRVCTAGNVMHQLRAPSAMLRIPPVGHFYQEDVVCGGIEQAAECAAEMSR
jgi:hypothetical protein